MQAKNQLVFLLFFNVLGMSSIWLNFILGTEATKFAKLKNVKKLYGLAPKGVLETVK